MQQQGSNGAREQGAGSRGEKRPAASGQWSAVSGQPSPITHRLSFIIYRLLFTIYHSSLTPRRQPTNSPAPPLSRSSAPPLPAPYSLLPLLAYLLLTLILTWPLVINLRTAVPNDIGDPLLNTWILAWDAHALLTDPLNLFNANIFHPLPHTLAYSEHLISTALLALPLQLITAEPVAAYNLSLLLAFTLSAWGMYLLALHWTGSRGAAFIAGLVFGFAPYRLAAIAHLQLLTFQWLPLALLFLDKAFRGQGAGVSRQWRNWFLFGFFLWLQLLASWYLAVYTGLIVGVYLLFKITNYELRITNYRLQITQRAARRQWVGLLVSLLVVFAATLPFALPYVGLLDALREARPVELALSLAAAPTDYAAAAPFNRIFGPLTAPFRARPGFTEENTLFVGLVAPLLLLIYILRLTLRRFAPPQSPPAGGKVKEDKPPRPLAHCFPAPHLPSPFSLLLILALSLLLTFPGPYHLLAQLFPPSTIIRVPPRWIIPALFALAGLTAFSIYNLQFTIRKTAHRSPFTIHNLLFIILTALLLAETFSAPIPLAVATPRAGQPPAYHWLAARPDAASLALIELPLHSAPAPEYPEVKRLVASTLGWWRLVNGYSGYTPPRQPVLAAALQTFPDDESIAALQNLASQSTSTVNNSPFNIHHSPFFLLVHPGEAPFNRSQWEDSARWQAEANPALLPVGEFAGDALYRVLPAQATQFAGPPLARFGADSSIELADIALLPAAAPNQPPSLALYWRAAAPVVDDVTVFIHLRAADGFVRSQADGPPVRGHAPASSWTPGEVVQDLHPLPPGEDIDDAVDHLAIGLYQPATGARLPAFNAAGHPLPDNALIIPLK